MAPYAVAEILSVTDTLYAVISNGSAMAGEDNLKPWKPGQSGNPKGREKGSRNRSTIVREALEAVAEDGVMYVDKATIAILAKAMAGDVNAYKELMDSGYGKVSDKTEITGKDGEEFKGLTVSFVKPAD